MSLFVDPVVALTLFVGLTSEQRRDFVHGLV